VKPDLKRNQDYLIVSNAVWNFLIQSYGGGPKLSGPVTIEENHTDINTKQKIKTQQSNNNDNNNYTNKQNSKNDQNGYNINNNSHVVNNDK